MNVKGLKLNKLLTKKILESYDSISLSNLYGIDSFNSFSWIGFSKEEFKNILSLLVYMFDRNAFNTIADDYPLIINYSTDITEMDIVTVLNDSNLPIFIDIESKNGDDFDELSNKINQQIEKRITDYLPQLIKNNKYIVAGFVNNTFIKAKIFDGSSLLEISTLDDFITTINGLSEYSECENFLV